MGKQANTAWKNIGAVGAGFLTIVFLSLAADQILHVLNVYPPWGQAMHEPGLNLLALSYRLVFTVLGGNLTARLASHAPMRQVWVLALIGTAIGMLGVVGTWNMGLGPRWYPVSLVLTGIPCTWLGGKLFLSFHVSYERKNTNQSVYNQST